MQHQQLSIFDQDEFKAKNNYQVVNVASVPHRSPFRYPGGKTWLVPTVRKWLKQEKKVVSVLSEPFAGGATVSLTAAFENLAEKVIMVEMDHEVAAVWSTILNGKNEWLAQKILQFDLTIDNIQLEFDKIDKNTEDIAFCTILKNRIFHGGIITKGSGLIKNGENGKGIRSRWYPKTLHDRINGINLIKNKITFIEGDAFNLIEEHLNNGQMYFFIDPPYTVAGKRLYTYFDIDHEKLFSLMAKIKGRFLMTYDDTPDIRALCNKYNLLYRTIPMKTTHHLEKNEILISDNLNW